MRSALWGVCILCAAATMGPSRAGAQAPASTDATAGAPSKAAAASPATASQSKASATDAVRRRYRHYRRLKRAGWTMAGVSVVGWVLTTVIYSKACHCSGFLCFCDPAVGAILGAFIFGPPFIAGIITGSIGSARARRYLDEHPVLAHLQIGVARNGFALGYRF